MPQPPFKADNFEVAPSLVGQRLIAANASTGALEITDPVLGTVALSNLSGLQTIPNLRIVAPTGVGATHTTIQDALDSIPSTSSDTTPYVVLVCSGVYYEDVVIHKNVIIQALGWVFLFSALDATPDAVGNQSTITIEEGPSSVPSRVTLKNLVIANSHTGKAGVFLDGGAASDVGALGILVQDCVFQSTAVGANFGIHAVSCGNLTVAGCGHNASSSLLALDWYEQVANLRLLNSHAPAIVVDYNSAGTLSSATPSLLELSRVTAGIFDTSISPAMVLDVTGFPSPVSLSSVHTPDILFAGNASYSAQQLVVSGGLEIEDSVSVTPYSSTYGAVTQSGTATLDRERDGGEISFVASDLESVTFDAPRSDNNYNISLTLLGGSSVNEEIPFVLNRLTTGFQIGFTSNQTLDVSWNLMTGV